MAKKGAIAKQDVISKISTAFGQDFIGEVDKKIYVWGNENGEKVQIAIALTCPNNPIPVDGTVAVSWDKVPNLSENMNFEDMDKPVEPIEIKADERQNIQDLMERLGL